MTPLLLQTIQEYLEEHHQGYAISDQQFLGTHIICHRVEYNKIAIYIDLDAQEIANRSDIWEPYTEQTVLTQITQLINETNEYRSTHVTQLTNNPL